MWGYIIFKEGRCWGSCEECGLVWKIFSIYYFGVDMLNYVGGFKF